MLSYKKPRFDVRSRCSVEVLDHHFGLVDSSQELAERALANAESCILLEDMAGFREEFEKFSTAVATMRENPVSAHEAAELEEQMFDLVQDELHARHLMLRVEDRHESEQDREVDRWIEQAEAARAS